MKIATCPRCKSEFPEDVLENPAEIDALQAQFNREKVLGCELCDTVRDLRKLVKFTADEVRRVYAGGEFDEKFYNEKYGTKIFTGR